MRYLTLNSLLADPHVLNITHLTKNFVNYIFGSTYDVLSNSITSTCARARKKIGLFQNVFVEITFRFGRKTTLLDCTLKISIMSLPCLNFLK